ncbi:hypothetical protein GCM10007301_13030 [Azorhizobium oxalatiphilum]|uniref:Uncharacterized protein n=1 Tax=Azorhizobium oxalatiphilum TaxID=980631 RepID=A0A917F975_9HYPH|nr:hypothetical protein [Azorhizobium oxalatiphilum]GGF54887.1 hypothetical protein GCM10007301_13030 [Azorhizobium oxalatiphilum]
MSDERTAADKAANPEAETVDTSVPASQPEPLSDKALDAVAGAGRINSSQYPKGWVSETE